MNNPVFRAGALLSDITQASRFFLFFFFVKVVAHSWSVSGCLDSLQQERVGAGSLTASVVPTNGEISNRLGDNTRGEIEKKKKAMFF